MSNHAASSEGASSTRRNDSEPWSLFERRVAENRWRRGVACVPDDACTHEQAFLSSTYSDSSTGMVNLQCWNSYWERFSEMYGDRLDELASQLTYQSWHINPDTHHTNEDCVNATGLAYRRVLLKLPRRLDSSLQLDTTHPTMDKMVHRAVRAALMQVARAVGAVEYVDHERRVWSVQFTTVVAAASFQRCVAWCTMGELLLSYLSAHPHTSGTQHESSVPMGGGGCAGTARHTADACRKDRKVPASKNDRWWCENMKEAVFSQYDESAKIVTKLAPCERHRTATRRLILGPGILLPTPFAESLFKGMFEATEVRYETLLQSFLVDFGSCEAAQLALHALQYSFHVVFHNSLHYDTVDIEC